MEGVLGRPSAAAAAAPLRLRPEWAVGAAAVCGSVATAVIALVPAVRFAYRAEQLHVAIETTASLVAVVVAFLAVGRLRRSRRLDDVLLAAALATLAATNIAFALIPAIVAGTAAGRGTWTGIGGHLAAATLIAAAAFAPATTVRRGGSAALALVLVVVAVDAIAVAALGDRLPPPIASLQPDRSGTPDLVGDSSVLAVQLSMGGLYALAALGFLLRAMRRRDPFLTFLAAGSTLAALARVNYFLYPSLYSQWVYVGDFFRLAFYALLFVGALREITDYWRALGERAVLEERRRLARDLHDGLAQELAYIIRMSKVAPADAVASFPIELRAAAERAVQQSRQAIAALATPTAEPLDQILARVATETGARYGVEVDVELAPGIELDAARAEALVRITGEAVANAARHSGAHRVRVVAEWRRGRPRLQVIDRGSGFDPVPAGLRASTYGLTSMRERAAAVGAEFSIRSRPGVGTCVEVSL